MARDLLEVASNVLLVLLPVEGGPDRPVGREGVAGLALDHDPGVAVQDLGRDGPACGAAEMVR